MNINKRKSWLCPVWWAYCTYLYIHWFFSSAYNIFFSNFTCPFTRQIVLEVVHNNVLVHAHGPCILFSNYYLSKQRKRSILQARSWFFNHDFQSKLRKLWDHVLYCHKTPLHKIKRHLSDHHRILLHTESLSIILYPPLSLQSTLTVQTNTGRLNLKTKKVRASKNLFLTFFGWQTMHSELQSNSQIQSFFFFFQFSFHIRFINLYYLYASEILHKKRWQKQTTVLIQLIFK